MPILHPDDQHLQGRAGAHLDQCVAAHGPPWCSASGDLGAQENNPLIGRGGQGRMLCDKSKVMLDNMLWDLSHGTCKQELQDILSATQVSPFGGFGSL